MQNITKTTKVYETFTNVLRAFRYWWLSVVVLWAVVTSSVVVSWVVVAICSVVALIRVFTVILQISEFFPGVTEYPCYVRRSITRYNCCLRLFLICCYKNHRNHPKKYHFLHYSQSSTDDRVRPAGPVCSLIHTFRPEKKRKTNFFLAKPILFAYKRVCRKSDKFRRWK